MIKVAILGHRRHLAEILDAFGSMFHLRTLLSDSEYKQELNRDAVVSLLHWADVSLFEWADDALVFATREGPFRSRIVTRLHGYELFAHAPDVAWEMVDRVVLVGEAYRNRFLSLHPECADRAVAIGNVVDVEFFVPTRDRETRFTMGSLGLITPKKRFYELLIAFGRLATRFPRLILHIAGPFLNHHDYYNAALRELPERLGLADRISFDGPIPARSERLVEWYRGLDLFISNSYFESFHLAMHEAMSCGCHTLGHAWSGVEEFLPASRIFVTEEDLVEKVAEFYLGAEALRQQCYAASRDWITERFGENRQVRRLADTIVEVARLGPRHPKAM